MYDNVEPLNDGLNDPLEIFNDARVASFDTVAAALITLIEYLKTVPSCAVTSITIEFDPTFRLIDPLADPELTVVPLTVIVALA